MALIENLDRGNWQEFLGNMFAHALYILKNDRFRWAGSSIDDLKAWLARGGVPRVKEALAYQVEQRRYTEEKQQEILAFVDQLAEKHRPQLMELVALGIIPATPSEWMEACGITPEWLDDWVARVNAGERPFDDWMYAHGHSYEDIVEVYSVIDDYLIRAAPPLPPPRDSSAPPLPRLNTNGTDH